MRKKGYKNPPQEHQFKKGFSGNPKGRPKKSRPEASKSQDQMREVLAEFILANINGTAIKMTHKRALQMRLITDALNGKPHAMRFILPELLQSSHQKESDPLSHIDQQKNDNRLLESFIKNNGSSLGEDPDDSA
jgi:hypothetical protein